MTRKAQRPISAISLTSAELAAAGDAEVVFLRGAVGDGTPVIREGQNVSYEVVRGQDGRLYAVNIIIIDEPNLH
ncbi:cold-shock protein [Pseudomonas putida]|uniref:cold-shock protein n=1 Tax=Pseudomonas putida TaxID=303 RepID=UPI0012ACFEB9|nr:cold-shock protein [Pseudomonas putida]